MKFFFFILCLTYVQALDDFNCKDECGLYTPGDVTMENLQTECKAFDAAIKCAEKDIRLEKLKIKTRKKAGTRVVGGNAVKLPLPWMVFLDFNNNGDCGGSLLNSR
ncbi:uncharacterized protein LOC111715490 [Eurytemora carolleeae]|uniref:uncharacterized protein LOC111715490 n=1 Tax=Eurytemora carolleeae TaxID=1294199 RepID=UPI000C76C496|nr:uncharacterized protein LOC111715490 [Eurytemora carolleeae]|eukprot:XP_023346589.1 uncharacterized protein LOC111715490 [Eurytemora affinis]